MEFFQAKNIEKKEKAMFYQSLNKSMSKKTHSIHDRTPHFIFSAENPVHPSKFKMTHEEVMDFLDVRGYKIEEMNGKYGDHEKSILIHNPSKYSIKHLKQLSSDLGQDSSIYSDGYNHELHFHHGDSAGQHVKGQGSNFHRFEPQDNYSTLDDGTHFTHNLNFDEYHKDRDSMVPDKPSQMAKSERIKRFPYLRKSETVKSPFSKADTKLIHYSSEEGLKSIDPSFQGSKRKDTSSKQGIPAHPMSFFYHEDSEPESLVTSGAKSKYITSVGDKKLYDRGVDTEGVGASVMESLRDIASKRSINPNVVSNDEYNNALHGKLKEMGYHGIHNSSLPSMKNVVGLFGDVEIDSEHKMHPNDFKNANAIDHHEAEKNKENAKSFAKENGHHNYKFLNNLSNSLKAEGEE